MRSRTCLTLRVRSRWRAPRINRSNAAHEDAFLVQRLQAAGAVLVGSLNMDEYAYGFTTENTHYGPCHNPHDLTRIAGGSSGGSGAAVAAGQVPWRWARTPTARSACPRRCAACGGSSPPSAGCRGAAATRLCTALTTSARWPIRVEGLALVMTRCSPRCAGPGLPCAPVSSPRRRSLRKGTGLRIGLLGGYFHDNATAPAPGLLRGRRCWAPRD
jgi:hypothetical protein